VLDKICKRISIEKPSLPIFTIHDSIITTRGNESYIQLVMKEELEKGIGKVPILAIEPLQKQNNQISIAA
jgi:hypothetical protein